MTAGYFKDGSFVLLKRLPVKIASFSKMAVLNEKNAGVIVIASVVPELERAAKKIFKKRVLVIKNRNVPLLNLYDYKDSVGVDRLLASLGAVKRYKVPCIVVDFGTATTINVIGKKGEFKGGLICPGASLFSSYLFEKTSLLPNVALEPVKRVIGRNTKDCIRAGVFHGYTAMISGLIRKVRTETGRNLKVIATGGWGKMLSPFIKEISVYDPYLVFYGMQFTAGKTEDRR